MRCATALPGELELRLTDEATRHGHQVTARCATAAELASAIASGAVEVALVATSPRYLSAELLALADERGARLVGVATTDADRRYGAALGLLEVADAASEWSVFEQLLAGHVIVPASRDAAPTTSAEPVDPRPLRFADESGGGGVLSPRASGAAPRGLASRLGERSAHSHSGASLPGRVHTGGAYDGSSSSDGARSDDAPVSGSVLAVWGPSGAPGRTSIATAIAGELAAAGQRVVLVDADTHAAAVAPSLGLLDEAPGFAAACRLAAADRFDEVEFERVAPVQRSGGRGFRVLTGIANTSRWPELGEDRVASVLQSLRAWNDWVVVDTAAGLEHDEELMSDVRVPRRNAATLATLRTADAVLAIGAADPIGIARLLRTHPELVAAAETARVLVAVNRLRSSVLGIDPSGEVRRALLRLGGIEPVAFIPYDRAAFDAALLSSDPLPQAAPRSAARRAIRDLVERELVPPSTNPGRGIRWRRAARSTIASG